MRAKINVCPTCGPGRWCETHKETSAMNGGSPPSPAQRESERRWSTLEREVFFGAAVMRGSDVGAKMSIASRLQTLAEDLQSALERDDEEP